MRLKIGLFKRKPKLQLTQLPAQASSLSLLFALALSFLFCPLLIGLKSKLDSCLFPRSGVQGVPQGILTVALQAVERVKVVRWEIAPDLLPYYRLFTLRAENHADFFLSRQLNFIIMIRRLKWPL